MDEAHVSEGDIKLDLVSSTEWRVRDRRYPEGDHRAVLGVIARTDKGYEALSLAHPLHTHLHISLASATASFWDPQFLVATDSIATHSATTESA